MRTRAHRLTPLVFAIGACKGSVETTTAPPAPVASVEPPATIVEVPPDPRAPTVEPASAWPLHAGRVLLSTEASPDWATGPVLLLDGNDYHEKWQIERAADLGKLPPELRAYAGTMVDLYGPRGRVCTIAIETLTIEAHVLMEYVDGDYVEPGGDALWKSLPDAEDHDPVVLLVGSFAENSACAEALWARPASLPPPELLVVGDVRDHATLLAEERRHALESDLGQEFSEKYQQYVADPQYAEDAEPWSSVSNGEARVWVDSRGAARYVALDFGNFEFAPCVWQGPTYGYQRQVGDGPDGPHRSRDFDPLPAAVFDADLDGLYEALIVRPHGDFEIVKVVSTTPALDVEVSLPDHSWVWC